MKMGKLISNKYFRALVAGALVACMYLVFLYANNIAPLGDESWLKYDMDRQYLDFYSYYKTYFTGKSNILYSFDISLGAAAVGFFTYYLSSPWLLLSLLFDKTQMPAAVAIMSGLKLMTAAFTCNLFMAHVGETSKTDNSTQSRIYGRYIAGVMGSVSYVFSSFIISNMINPMWLDVFYMMPLFLWMADRLLFRKKITGYIISLSAMIIFNYYIAFMVCLFTVMWVIFRLIFAPCEYVDTDKYEITLKNTVMGVVRIGICSLWAVAIDGVLMIPTALELFNSPKDITELGFILHDKNIGMNVLLSKMFWGAYDVYQTIWGTPLLYAGIATIILTILYFMNSKIGLREKAGVVMMLGIFFISFFSEKVNLLWHAGMEPSGYPYREAFMYVFVCVYCSFRCICNLHEGINSKKVLAAFAVVVLMFAAVLWRRDDYLYVYDKVAFINVVFIFGAVILILQVLGDKEYLAAATVFLLLALQVLELVGNSVIVYRNQNSFGDELVAEYSETTQKASNAVSKIKATDTSFYRIENLSPREQNDPMMFDYKGITHYSSAGTLYTRDFLMTLGFNDDGLLATYGCNNTCTADTILGIKYTFGDETKRQIHPDYQEKDYSNGGYWIKNNLNAFSIAMLSNSVSDLKADSVAGRKNNTLNHVYDIDPFEYQQDIVADMSGEKAEIFIPATISDVDDYRKEGGNLDREYEVKTEADGELYFYIDGIKRQVQNFSIFVNDEFVTTYGNFGCHSILNLGYHKTGDVVIVRVVTDSPEPNFGTARFMTEDFVKLAEISTAAESRKINVIENSSSNITLKLPEACASEYKKIIMTAPYDTGWSAKCNGKSLKINKIYGSMMELDISNIDGDEIQMNFVPDGMKSGVVVSLISLLAFIAFIIIVRRPWNILHHDSAKE